MADQLHMIKKILKEMKPNKENKTRSFSTRLNRHEPETNCKTNARVDYQIRKRAFRRSDFIHKRATSSKISDPATSRTNVFKLKSKRMYQFKPGTKNQSLKAFKQRNKTQEPR